MVQRQADMRTLVSHVKDCASALQARIEALEFSSEDVSELERSSRFLMGAIAALERAAAKQ